MLQLRNVEFFKSDTVYCLYHSSDLDGHCSGGIQKFYVELLGKKAIMVPVNYDRTKNYFENIPAGSDVILSDMSWPKEKMMDIIQKYNLVWLDHHISIIRDMEEVDVPGYRVDGVAACELTWQWCFDDPVPETVKLLSYYDTWKMENENWHSQILPYQYRTRLDNTDPAFPGDGSNTYWKDIFAMDPAKAKKFVSTYVREGKLLLKYEKQNNKRYLASYGFEVKFEGFNAFVVNRGCTNSMMFDHLKNKDQYDLFITFCFNGKGYNVSLYSEKVDVSELAKKHGGGGHKGASGFLCDVLPFSAN